MNDIDLSTEALLKHRAIAEKATPGPWHVLAPDAIFICGQGEGEYLFENPQEISTSLLPEEQRADAAHIAANSPDVVKAHIDEILRLRAEVERLEREAEWLANHCREFCKSYSYCGECPMFRGWLSCVYEDCGETVGYRGEQHTANWREAARKAVEKGV